MIANTGDDVEVYGVHVSPDPDLVTYWLADAIDERGYGIRDDTWEVMDALEARRPAGTGSGSATATWRCALCAPSCCARARRPTEAHAAVVEAHGRAGARAADERPARGHRGDRCAAGACPSRSS